MCLVRGEQKRRGPQRCLLFNFFSLIYSFFFFHPYRSANHNTHRTALHCVALHTSRTVPTTGGAKQKQQRICCCSPIFVLPTDSRESAGAPCSREPTQPNSQKCVLRCVEVPGAHLNEGDPRAGVSCSSFLLLVLHSHGRKHIAFTTGEVEHTSRRSINRTCEFKGHREAATCLKSLE